MHEHVSRVRLVLAALASLAPHRFRAALRRQRRRIVAPGVTDTEILVGTHMPLTGPAAAGYSKIAPATKAYFDYVNATAASTAARSPTRSWTTPTTRRPPSRSCASWSCRTRSSRS